MHSICWNYLCNDCIANKNCAMICCMGSSTKKSKVQQCYAYCLALKKLWPVLKIKLIGINQCLYFLSPIFKYWTQWNVIVWHYYNFPLDACVCMCVRSKYIFSILTYQLIDHNFIGEHKIIHYSVSWEKKKMCAPHTTIQSMHM